MELTVEPRKLTDLPLYEGVKIENPETILPISAESAESKVQLWTGSKTHWNLFLSGNYNVVEVDDTSKLVNGNSGVSISPSDLASAENVTKVQSPGIRSSMANVRLLIGVNTYEKIGPSRLSDLGTVRRLLSIFENVQTNTRKMRTLAIKKLPDKKIPKNCRGTILRQNKEIFLVETELHDMPHGYDTKMNLLVNGNVGEEGFEIGAETVCSILKRRFIDIFNISRSTLLTMLIFRLIFGYLLRKRDLLSEDPLKNAILKLGEYCSSSNAVTICRMWYRGSGDDSNCGSACGGRYVSWLSKWVNSFDANRVKRLT